jgi:hypothetical protein
MRLNTSPATTLPLNNKTSVRASNELRELLGFSEEEMSRYQGIRTETGWWTRVYKKDKNNVYMDTDTWKWTPPTNPV